MRFWGEIMTTNVFGAYADFYDTFYRDKDYAAECDAVERVLAQYATKPARTILDLGCGTGGHVLPLAQRGYVMTGVDQSEGMLQAARVKAQALPLPHAPRFFHGDIRAAKLDETFDAVVCMFAVLSYMVTNEDLAAALAAARRHLEPGGVFYMDAWFGPAVLTERPSDRFRIIGAGQERVIRFVHPEADVLHQQVRVHYKVLALEGTQVTRETDEVHPMRYFFPQELAYFMHVAGFAMERMSPFLEPERALTERDWNFEVVARAV